MKPATELPYPPWWLRRAAERKIVLDQAVTRLAAFCGADSTIVKALVFGSYATGKLGPKSDLDVIVVQQSAQSQLTRTAEMYVKLAAALNMPVDLIVYTPDEFEHLSKTRNFVIQAVAQGRLIYARTPA